MGYKIETLKPSGERLYTVYYQVNNEPAFAVHNLSFRTWMDVKDVTTIISGEKYVTLSMVLPLTQCLKETIKAVQPESDIGLSLKEQLLTSIKTRLEPLETNPLIGMAAILDPRFKKMHFQNPMNALAAINRINLKLRATPRESNTAQEEVVPEGMEPEVPDIWSFHEKKVAQENKKVDRPDDRRNLHLDLTKYLSTQHSKRNVDPLEYWENQKQNFPALAKLALEILVIPAAAVPCERLFSAAQGIMEPSRNRLTPDRLSRLLFLESLELKDWHLES